MNSTQTAKTRVAVYIRIGGNQNCDPFLRMEMGYYAMKASQNQGGELVAFYSDVGKDSAKRPNLHRLLTDCRAGRFDLIVTRNATRIARDLDTVLSIMRELASLSPPVGVYFEDYQFNSLSVDFSSLDNEPHNLHVAFGYGTKKYSIAKPMEKHKDQLQNSAVTAER